MDIKCSQLLPSVCTVLADPRAPVSDDTCLEKLLDWFKMLTKAGPSLLLLEENPCLAEMILAVLRQEDPSPGILSFVLRLTGMFAASESSFQHLQQGEVVFGAFGEAGPLGSALWEDMSIRSGWVQGAYTMLQHYSAFQFLCNSGALDVIFTLQGDRSLFIASGANRLLACLLIFSVQSELSRLLSTKDCDWPACARMIVARVEESLRSRSSSRVQHSLKLLTTLFEHNQDAWTEVLWSRIAETVGALLTEESILAGHSLVDLFLSMARSPAFHCQECSLWKLVTLALKNLSLAQAGPLALGLLTLEACPQAVKVQSLNILLLPMGCILRAASDALEFPGLLDGPPTNRTPVASLLSSRSSCISLLCQSLVYLEEIQGLVGYRAVFLSLVPSRCVGLPSSPARMVSDKDQGSPKWANISRLCWELQSDNISRATHSLYIIHLLEMGLGYTSPFLQQVCLAGDFPHKPLLHSVVTVLQFCVGLAVPVSSLGATVGKILIGCFRVQRAALGLLGALSRWATSVHDEVAEEVFDILLVYLKSPDTSPTVLKKAFQATLKWLLSVPEPSGSTDDFGQHKQFHREMLPVLQKRLCSPSWEVRDSSLEYLTLSLKHLRGQEWFCQELLSSEVPALARGLLDDPESYVRASAAKASGQFSLVAGVGSETPGSENNGSHKEAGIGTRLLEILSTDTEGFPRRAVISVFIDWLREGHPEALADPEQFVSRAIQAMHGDLDWEVKVTGLELASVFAAQTFGRLGLVEGSHPAHSSPARQPGCPSEALQTFCRVKLFDFLFGALCDCDRPVALKACEVLRAVKAKICGDSCLEQGKSSEPAAAATAPKEAPRGASLSALILPFEGFAERASQDLERLLLLLETTDLEGLQRALDVSSDHLEQNPQSLLQDILSAAGSMEENEADCY